MKKDGIYQPNAVVETTLMNNPTLNVRSLLMKNKDGFGLPLEQFIDTVNGFCLQFREIIMNSPNIKDEDLIVTEPPNLVIHVNQDAKAAFLLLIVQDLDNKAITDPILCEVLHQWAHQMATAGGKK